MTDAPAQLTFLPWLREGLAAALGGAAPGQLQASAAVTLAFAGGGQSGTTVRLYGPADVSGLDPAQVIRTEPHAGATDFEPNYLAAIEFDEPSLPWLLSPEPSAGDRLQPWICLVVAPEDGAAVSPSGPDSAPVLTLTDAGVLPNLAEACFWAHAQLLLAGDTVEHVLGTAPERTLSRLVAPTRLEPDTAYIACVVPTYLSGVQAGLGRPVTATRELAWSWPASGAIELPAYYSWRFTTSDLGSFELLARRLVPRALPGTVGRRDLDISAADPALPGRPGAMLDFEGALMSPALVPRPWPAGLQQPFQAALNAVLTTPPGSDAVLAPPVYGRFPAGYGQAVPPAGAPPVWLRSLNLDPRWRAAAGLGARIVAGQREQLLAGAWQQAGEVREANRLRRGGRVALAVARTVFDRRVAPLEPTRLLQVTQPAHTRIALAAAPAVRTVAGRISASVLPDAVPTTAFRRTLGPGRALGRAIARDNPAGVAGVVRSLATGSVAVPVSPYPDGATLIERVAAKAGVPDRTLANAGAPVVAAALGWRQLADIWHDASAAALAAPRARESLLPAGNLNTDIGETLRTRVVRLTRINVSFQAAAQLHQQYLDSPPPPPPGQTTTALSVDDLAHALVGTPGGTDGALHPARTIPPQVSARVTLAGAAPTADPLADVRVAPSFPQPMAEPLRELLPDALLPGGEQVPPETVSVLEANAGFIEAYLVGLNHELARELLFQDYPLDARATFFRRFWDATGRYGAQTPLDDIPPIGQWQPAGDLGSHETGVGAGSSMLVLFLQGALVRRYPRLSLYAVAAQPDGTLGSDPRYPEFRGTLDPDRLFAGFALDEATARGDGGAPGWYFVLQEQPTEPRFGLEPLRDAEPRYGRTPAHWNALSWGDVVADEQHYTTLTTLPAGGRLANVALDGSTWGRSAADMARILLQPPARVAIHASRMLP